MTKFSALIFISGLAFLLMVITSQLPIGQAPMLIGNSILSNATQEVGTANIVTSVVLAYRGLDTLGELSILFTAAMAVSLIIVPSPLSKNQSSTPTQPAIKRVNDLTDSGFISKHAIDLLFPLLLIVGFYIIIHGHLTPGGGFQGGVILACAFFMGLMVRPKSQTLDHQMISMIESFSGTAFILIGLLALFSGKSFLQPLLGHGDFGSLWSAGTLPLLYLAVGLKVGAELAGLLVVLFQDSNSGTEVKCDDEVNS
jgi:multicomponent Na+:H+ antiporter subunit B